MGSLNGNCRLARVRAAVGARIAGGRLGRSVRRVGVLSASVAVMSAGLAAVPQLDSNSSAAAATPQTITFAPLASRIYGDAPFAVSATASSGLPVSFSVVNSGSVCNSSGTNGSTITLSGAGTCTVQADQAGDSTYAAAPSVDQAFTVSAASASISVSNIPGSGSGLVGGTFTAAYTYNGNGTTSVTSRTLSVCLAAANEVFLVGAGTCTVDAHATGTSQYLAVDSSDQSFTVTSPVMPSCGKSNPNAKTWANPVSGNWSDPSNWSPAGVPTSSNDVCIKAAGSYTITVDAGASAGTLQLIGSTGTQTLDVAAGESLSINGNSSVGKHGVVSMEDDNNVSSLYLNGHTLTNTGTLTVDAATGGDYAYLASTGTLFNAGTVQVAGALALNSATFTNGVGGSVSVASGGAFTGGTFVQAGGSNSGVAIAPSTLEAGGTGSAAFTAEGLTVQGGPVQSGQSIDIPAGGSMSLGADLTSGGTITMEDNNNVSYLYLNGHTLTNSGTLTVNAASGGDYAYLYSTGTFTNTGTVQVAGQLYLGGATFTNGVGGRCPCSPAGRSPPARTSRRAAPTPAWRPPPRP